MKKTTKLAALFAAALMLVLSFSGCASANGVVSEGDAQVVEEKTTLIMATCADFSPYEFVENGEIVGVDAEIAAAIAEKLGMELQIEDMDFNAVVAAVASGKVDMAMSALSVTEERLQSVDFSTTYATGVQVIIVKEDSAITSVDDLFNVGGFTIGVQESTTGDIYSTGDFGDAGLATIERYSKGADAVQALVTDKIDCVIIDNEPAKVFVSTNEGLKILDTKYVEEDYAIAIGKGNTELLDQINAAIEELIADGTVKSILDKYISAE